ncbi:muramidase [Vulcanococcus limneticus]|uniref:glycoside hydrolase family 24 protein n=1 Tax=Vulcanococcus limneticus TaxID=2170428 RepID=UPI00398BE7E1
MVRRPLPGSTPPLFLGCALASVLALPLLVEFRPESAAAQGQAMATGSPAVQDAPDAREAAPARPAGHYAITPERRALLNTIRYAEGTWLGGRPEGYRTLYGGGRFASLERHPEIVVVKRYASAAAGAYQFLPGTWGEASRKLRLARFDPASQDQAALYLVERRGALGAIDRGGLDRQAMARLAGEWASFPTLAGASAYGQPVKSAEELERFYSASLRRARSAEQA